LSDGKEAARMSKEDWEALFRRCFPAVERCFASRRVGSADADDLTQEVFKELARCRVPSEPKTYVLAIARNVLARYRRRMTREQAALGAYSQHCKADREAVESNALGEGRPEESLADELDRFLKTTAHKLSAGSSELVELRFREGLSVRQIARRMKCSEDAVWKRLQRLRAILRRDHRESIIG